MSRTIPSRRYGGVTQTIHWLTAVLVLAAFIYGPGGNETRVYSAAKDFDRQLHETLGLCVFALAFVRVLWHAMGTRPEPVEVPRWMGIAAKAVQWTLYVLLFAVPIAAISGAWLEGHPLTLLGGARIGPFTPEIHDAGQSIATLHTWLGDAILWVAGFHALAGLYHHFILKDSVLGSMLPRRLLSQREKA
jgi:cytochrome b561